jgi:hypothetical protein
MPVCKRTPLQGETIVQPLHCHAQQFHSAYVSQVELSDSIVQLSFVPLQGLAVVQTLPFQMIGVKDFFF